MKLAAEPTANGDGRPAARTWLDALPCAALLINSDGRIAGANGEAEMILGWPAPELEGLSASELLASRDDPTGGSVVPSAIDNSVPERGQRLIRCADDAFRPIEYSSIPFPVEQGLGAIFGFRELTRERELENDLRRLASIADESPIPIVELNQDANLMYANPAMMALVERFGFSTEARPLALPANILKLTRECLETHTETGAIEVSVGDNHYEWKLFPVPGAKLVRGYGMDATSRKRAMIELTLAKATSEVASQAKSKMLSNVSDELHGPLETIATAVDSLLDGTLTSQQLEAVKSIRSSCSALMTAVEEVLSVAALQSDNSRPEPMPFNIRALIARVLAPFIRQGNEKQIQLTLTISTQVPGEVTCDALRLEQLFRTILRNLTEVARGGEITIEVDRDTIALPRASENTHQCFRLFINIGYSGPGILSSGRNIVEGTGSDDAFAVGRVDGPALAICCRQLAGSLGGTVRIEQDRSGGSFCFSLPVRYSKSGMVRFASGNDKHAAI